jgi:hypothetical protein
MKHLNLSKEENRMKSSKGTVLYFWRIIYAHCIAYFLAGIFALVVMNYKDLFATDTIASIMRQTTEPMVALGPALQWIRAIIIGLVLLPLRKAFFETQYGFLKLGLVVLGFSLLSTIGPTMGSFDGYIYTIVPAFYQILGYPEAILYILLFIGILKFSYTHDKKWVTVVSVVCMVLIELMGFMGYLAAKGLIQT